MLTCFYRRFLLGLIAFGMVGGAMSSDAVVPVAPATVAATPIAADVAVPVAEWEAIKARLNELEGRTGPATVVTGVDTTISSKYGPGANVTTKIGKLQIGLLTQVWSYGFQHDSRGSLRPDIAITSGIKTTATPFRRKHVRLTETDESRGPK